MAPGVALRAAGAAGLVELRADTDALPELPRQILDPGPAAGGALTRSPPAFAPARPCRSCSGASQSRSAPSAELLAVDETVTKHRPRQLDGEEPDQAQHWIAAGFRDAEVVAWLEAACPGRRRRSSSATLASPPRRRRRARARHHPRPRLRTRRGLATRGLRAVSPARPVRLRHFSVKPAATTSSVKTATRHRRGRCCCTKPRRCRTGCMELETTCPKGQLLLGALLFLHTLHLAHFVALHATSTVEAALVISGILAAYLAGHGVPRCVTSPLSTSLPEAAGSRWALPAPDSAASGVSTSMLPPAAISPA